MSDEFKAVFRAGVDDAIREVNERAEFERRALEALGLRPEHANLPKQGEPLDAPIVLVVDDAD